MKRVFLGLMVLVLLTACLPWSPAFAIGTHACGQPVSVTPANATLQATQTYTVTCQWQDDPSNPGNVPSVVIPGTRATDSPSLLGWYPYQVDVWPGTTAPTNGYTLTLTVLIGSTAFDLLSGGSGTSLTFSSTTGTFVSAQGNGKPFRRVIGPLTGNISGNSVASGSGSYTITFVPQ